MMGARTSKSTAAEGVAFGVRHPQETRLRRPGDIIRSLGIPAASSVACLTTAVEAHDPQGEAGVRPIHVANSYACGGNDQALMSECNFLTQRNEDFMKHVQTVQRCPPAMSWPRAT